MSNMNNRCHLYLPLLPEKSPVRGRKDGPANGSFTFRKRGRTSINGKGRPGWIVQKFGGTSLGKFASEIVDEIIRPTSENYQVVVVCSAASRASKAEGTTNRLLQVCREAEKLDSPDYVTMIKAIELDHIQAAEQQLKPSRSRDQLIQDIKSECFSILQILNASCILGEVSLHCQEKIVSVGEKLSCLHMVALLHDRGVMAEYVNMFDIINIQSHTIEFDQGFYDNLSLSMSERILRAIGIPVVTGYFGSINGGTLHQIGRGYTDLCATLIAMGLCAQELQIWKEVDGIFTADPRTVPAARVLSTITPAEASKLTFYGSEVVHPFTMEQAVRGKIPVRVKNVVKPQDHGTLILPEWLDGCNVINSVSLTQDHLPKYPTAVTAKSNIVVINIQSNNRSMPCGFFEKIFSVLCKWKLPVDLVSSTNVQVSMAVHSEAILPSLKHDQPLDIEYRLKCATRELEGYGAVTIIPDMAIVSVIGKSLKAKRVASYMLRALGDMDINIEMIAHGASEVTVSCVINAKDADSAIKVLHATFFRDCPVE